MALTQDQLKSLIIAETGAASFQSGIDTLWPLWWDLYSGETNANVQELLLKRRMLMFLQGEYMGIYNVKQGNESREAKVMYDRVTGMLAAVNATLGPDAVIDTTPALNVSQMAPRPAVCNPYPVYGEPDACGGYWNRERGKP
jgi:hypothetical protein